MWVLAGKSGKSAVMTRGRRPVAVKPDFTRKLTRNKVNIPTTPEVSETLTLSVVGSGGLGKST